VRGGVKVLEGGRVNTVLTLTFEKGGEVHDPSTSYGGAAPGEWGGGDAAAFINQSCFS